MYNVGVLMYTICTPENFVSWCASNLLPYFDVRKNQRNKTKLERKMNRNDYDTTAVLILINRRCFAVHINDSFLRRTLMKDARGVNVPVHHGSLNGYLAQLIIIIYLVWLGLQEGNGGIVDKNRG